MDGPLLVYTTLPDEETALAIGEALVRDGLAACLTVLPGIRSVYRWEGRIEHGREVIALIKTREGRREAVLAAVRERHPYRAPAILVFSPEADAGTLAWLLEATGGDREPLIEV